MKSQVALYGIDATFLECGDLAPLVIEGVDRDQSGARPPHSKNLQREEHFER